ncbi:hypothetical protein MJO10_29035, partial [Salmonella enterica subsp. enterica serovar Anatum]|nr:hypothetical protein [Salmonella enterica subsp. enterica serovar Anatum]
VCTLHAQLVCKKAKKSVLSTDNLMTRWPPKAHHINSEVEKSHSCTAIIWQIMPLNIHHMNDKSKKRTKCQIY